jgi:hypothetical protein
VASEWDYISSFCTGKNTEPIAWGVDSAKKLQRRKLARHSATKRQGQAKECLAFSLLPALLIKNVP